MPSKTTFFKDSTILFTFLFLVWGLYRLIFKLPDEVEELVIKPVLWIVPVLFFLKKEKSNLESIGITTKNLFPAIYISLFLGVFFALLAVLTNFLKYNTLDFGANIGNQGLFFPIGISLATAISEEIVFRGFIFTRLKNALGNEWLSNLLTTIGWTLIHVPVTILVNKLDTIDALVYLSLIFIFGIGSAFIFARTKNLSSSILLHVLWEWPIMLFR